MSGESEDVLTQCARVDRFNHDEDAGDYDLDVTNADDPIRAGYDELLQWVTERAAIGATDSVLELGSGTGNLTAQLPSCARLVCVDISDEMTRIARSKLAGRPEISWQQADVLEALSLTSSSGKRGERGRRVHRVRLHRLDLHAPPPHRRREANVPATRTGKLPTRGSHCGGRPGVCIPRAPCQSTRRTS